MRHVGRLRAVARAMVMSVAVSAVAAPGAIPPPAAPTSDMITDEPVIAPVTTHHKIRVGDTEIHYTATFAEMPLTDSAGVLQATISSTTYLREKVRDVARRPVLFLFNGGPGASSSPLHFNAFGPRRLSEDRDAAGARKLLDNRFSLIDAADLVFIDPVGTGFSRERSGTRTGQFWGVESDATSVLNLIRTWLRDHGRTESPLFMAGESYGGFRLATLAKQVGDLKVAGLILISPLLDASATASATGNDQHCVFELPTMAVAAWEHQKIDRAGRSLEAFYDEAARFAQTEYLVALQQGTALPAADRARLAAKIATFIGLPAQQIEAANLRVDSEAFLSTLMADKQLIVGRLDTRVTAPKPNDRTGRPDRPPAANDPALGLGTSNTIKSVPIKNYMHDELGVNTSRDYISLTLDVNFRWDWRGDQKTAQFYVNPTANIASLLANQRQTRVLLVGGYYDLAVPVLGPRYALTHAGVPLDRVLMVALVAPHSAFQGDTNLEVGSRLVRDFLLGKH